MSERQSAGGVADQQPIVIHGPQTGDADRIGASTRELPVPSDTFGPRSVTPALEPVAPVSTAPVERVFGLDAFRGVLLLAMNFTFTIPPNGPFAKWMYHTQVPPSETRAYVALAGLTWQDMLFAMFVFTMAAAIPIAMNNRLARGNPYPELLWNAVRRGFLLWLFALIIGHVNPYWTQDYTKRGNILAIVGLVVSFLFFVQPPKHWKAETAKAIKLLGVIGVIALLFIVPPLVYGQTFSAEKRDGIMAALAFCTVAGTLVWLFTRARLGVRFAVFGVILAVRMLAPHVVFVGQIWNANPLPWFYQPWYMDLMLVVIPGTVAGDLIWQWMKRRSDATSVAWNGGRLAALAVLGLSFIPILNVGLYERRYPLQTTIAVVLAAALTMLVARGAQTDRDRVLARLMLWGTAWLVLGMFVEPLEGGIKKDPQTLGFLLLMTGTATTMLASFLIIFDTLKAGAKQIRPLALIGQNALFAYVVLMLGIEHVLWLTGIGGRFVATWQEATVRSFVLTFVAGFIVWIATKQRLVWKT